MAYPEILVGALSKSTQEAILTTCIVLQVIGVVGCGLLFFTAIFSSSVHRQATWLSFIFSWIFSGISYLLLFLTGNKNNLNPVFGVCVVQAALIYSAPILTATSSLVLVTQVYFNVRNMFSDGNPRNERSRKLVLLALPYLLHAAMTAGALALGFSTRETVHRFDLQTPYCNMKNRIPSKTSSIFVACTMIPTIILELVICRILRRNWAVLRRQRISVSTAARVLAFSFFGLVAIAISLVFASSNERNPEFNIILSFLPTAAFLVFGTQKDMIQAWMFWKKQEISMDKETDNSRTELTRTNNERDIDASMITPSPAHNP